MKLRFFLAALFISTASLRLLAQNVSPLTGDFNYGLPLLTVPGPNGEQYALSLSYNAGIGMEQQASLVGLGWNINIPSIARNVNGNPDDFLKSVTNSSRIYSNGVLTEISQLTGSVNYCFVNEIPSWRIFVICAKPQV
jgi:hypothetical protein